MIQSFSLYYLRKLDAYQEILRQDKRNRGPWPLERRILEWAGSEHNHLGSQWNYPDIKAKLEKAHIDLNELIPAIKNLEAKGLVDTAGSGQDICHFNENAIIMGEVLSAIENPLTRFEYWLVLWAFKLLLPVLVLTGFLAFLNQGFELVSRLHK